MSESVNLAALREFCDQRGIEISDRTREVLRLREEGLAWPEIYDRTGVQGSNGRLYVRRLKARADRMGFSLTPEIQANIPDGYKLRGVSTLYSHFPGGSEKRVEWVKTDVDKARQEELYKAFIEGLCTEIAPAKPVKEKAKKKYSPDLMPAIFIGDAHIGARAFGVETKHHDFDTKIATAQLREAFEYLTERAEPSENALFVNVGDLIHANTQHGQTYSGTPQDVDSRHYSVMKAAAECMAYGIDLQLRKHKNVTAVMARGNHDTDAAGALQLMLEFYYRDEPRVTVLPTHGFYHYIEWGNWLLGVHHGDKQKAESLASSMARDMPEAWGRTTHRMFCTGHYHKEAVKTLPGVKHKVFAALPPPDSWHASKGYMGDGEMELLTFRKSGGLHSSHVFNVPQPRVEPDVRLS